MRGGVSWCGELPKCGRCGCDVMPERRLCDTCKQFGELRVPTGVIERQVLNQIERILTRLERLKGITNEDH